jgi:flagellar motor switch protein FliN/FliY
MSDQPTGSETKAVQPGELTGKTGPNDDPLDINFILDIPLQVTVEVGRSKMMIQELLQLGKGSVIELNKMLGEPFEVMVNEKLVARGEVVVVNDRFGIRLTDIISPNERVQSLS